MKHGNATAASAMISKSRKGLESAWHFRIRRGDSGLHASRRRPSPGACSFQFVGSSAEAIKLRREKTSVSQEDYLKAIWELVQEEHVPDQRTTS